MEDKPNLCLTEGSPPFQVRAEAALIGDDLVVMLSGGDRPHIGAVAVGIPRPSLANREVTSATASVFAMVGHKEDDMARLVAREIAAALERNVVVTVGIHVDNISTEGIRSIEENCRSILEQLKEKLSKGR